MNPSLRKDITHGTGDGLKTLASADRRHVHNIVKDEVALIKSIIRSGELNRPAAVPLNELRSLVGFRWSCGIKSVFCLRFHSHSSLNFSFPRGRFLFSPICLGFRLGTA